MNKPQLGLAGQNRAEAYLQAKGLTTLATNYNAAGKGEIDLIMQQGSYIVFVEVKLRRSLNYGQPREAVNWRKQQKIKKAAMFYIASQKLNDTDFRFDCVEVYDSPAGLKVEHIEDAFW